MSHPTYTTLLGYIANQLPDVDRAKIEEHLFSQTCQQCTGKIARLRAVLEATTKDRTVAPPVAILRRAIALHSKRTINPLEPVLQTLAKLEFDSRLQPSQMLSRGASKLRLLLFSTPQVDIDLQITSEDDDHNLVGQVLSSEQVNEPMLAFVSLKNETGLMFKGTETDSLGQFTFRQIPTGVYNLVFDIDSQIVAITNVELMNE